MSATKKQNLLNTKKTILNYNECVLVMDLINSNDALDSYKNNYLPFLVEIKESYDNYINNMKLNLQRDIQQNEVELQVSIPLNVVDFLLKRIEQTPIFTLKTKLF